MIAVDNIDRVIQIIRAADDPDEAKTDLDGRAARRASSEFLRRAGRPEAEIAQAHRERATTCSPSGRRRRSSTCACSA